jgi:hypothetical protein
MFWSMGSNVLNVLESWLDLTMQTSTLPRQCPALKNDVCDEMRFARLSPAMGSIGSSASKGNVMTCRSAFFFLVPVSYHSNRKPTNLTMQSRVGNPPKCQSGSHPTKSGP